MPTSRDQQAFIEKAKQIYEKRHRAKLEASDFGKVIALEPESGDYVLGRDLMEVTAARKPAFGDKRVYVFRVGGWRGGQNRRLVSQRKASWTN